MFSGIVVHGKALGRQLGFPTANIDCKIKNGMNNSQGVFAALVKIDKKDYHGAAIVRVNKSIDCEIHIFNFSGDLYGKYVEVNLIQKVSEIEKYDSQEELLEKIKHDIEMVKEVFVARS